MKGQVEEKKRLLKTLETMPNISAACELAGIARTTYYRWRMEDPEFREAADIAMALGKQYIYDGVHAKAVSLVEAKRWPAIKYFLDRHPEFKESPSAAKPQTPTAQSAETRFRRRQIEQMAKRIPYDDIHIGKLPKKLRQQVVRKAIQQYKMITGAALEAGMFEDSTVPPISRDYFISALRRVLEENYLREPFMPPPTQPEETDPELDRY